MKKPTDMVKGLSLFALTSTIFKSDLHLFNLRKDIYCMELIKLFLIFAKIGACTFGGGYAMLPVLEREIVEKRGWATSEELMDYYAVSQCTPGVIAVNVATFIGKKRRGIFGGIFATLGVVFPSVIIIGAVSAFLGNISKYEAVQHALAGIRIAVCGLVSVSVYKIAKNGIVDFITAIVALIVLVSIAILKVSPVWCVLFAAAAGLITKSIRAKRPESSKSDNGENNESNEINESNEKNENGGKE